MTEIPKDTNTAPFLAPLAPRPLGALSPHAGLVPSPRFTVKHASEIWQGQQDSNPRPTVLETAALPAELYPLRNQAASFSEEWRLLDDS